MPQQALRRQHDERKRVDRQHRGLAAEQVEVLRGGRAVGDADVRVGGGLQESLDAGGRMLRPLAFVRMRQQQYQRWRQPPLRAARRDERVEDDLRAVDEVAVLRFPDHQTVVRVDVVAELEADRGQLRQRAVVNLERRARLREALQRDVRVAGRGVAKNRVAMAEGAAADILAGQANRRAVREDRGERQFLGRAPVDRLRGGVVQRVPALLARPFQLLVDRESARALHQAFVDRAQRLERHGRLRAGGGAGSGRRCHRRDEVDFGLERCQGLFERREVLLHQRVGVAGECVVPCLE